MTKRGKRVLGAVGLVVGLFAAWCVWAANGPDREIVFVREVPSAVPLATLDKAFRSVLSWPQWHHMTVEAKIFDLRGTDYAMVDQVVMSGSRVRFVVEPKGQRHRRFELRALIVRYEPNKLLHFRLVNDSTGRITRLFSGLEWKVELLPGAPLGAPGLPKDAASEGTLIRGTVTARTSSWRSRLLGRMAERILMNQVLYPNLISLAELTRPLTLESLPPTQQ